VDLSLGGGAFAPRFWAGVNLGATIPGHDPGELAITRSEYDHWLEEMGVLGVRLVAVVHLPWMLLGFSDPSSHRIFVIRHGSVSLARVGGVRVNVAIPDDACSPRA
jgi:hypothetical protein